MIEPWERRLTLNGAVLPPWLGRLDIRGLRVGEARVDLHLHGAGSVPVSR